MFFKVRYYLAKEKETAPSMAYDTNIIVALFLNIL